MRNMQEFSLEGRQLEEAGEMFSVGLTVISVGNLTDYSSLYDLQRRTFDEDSFLEALAAWSSNPAYSEVLRGIAVNLCSHDPTRRMTAGELWGVLSKHEESIAKKVNFVIDNAPPKLHEGVREVRRINARFAAERQAIL